MKKEENNEKQILAHPETEPILVTGATGNVGREVVKALHAAATRYVPLP